MQNSTQTSTACLDVTLQVNTAWLKQAAHLHARHARQSSSSVPDRLPFTLTGEEETVLLCSDIICVDDTLRAQPAFDTTTYVMAQAIAHTRRFCSNYGTRIRAFRSVEVLRMVEPGLPASFLFLFEAILVPTS